MKRLILGLVALGFLFSLSTSTLQAGEWRVGGGLAPYYGMHPFRLDDWGTGLIFSGNAHYVWKRHLRAYGRVTYGFKGKADIADKNYPIETISVGPEFFFKPFYIGVGVGSVWAANARVRYIGNYEYMLEVGGTDSSKFFELPIGLEFHVAKNYYLRVDLTREIWTTKGGWGYYGEARTVHLEVKI